MPAAFSRKKVVQRMTGEIPLRILLLLFVTHSLGVEKQWR